MVSPRMRLVLVDAYNVMYRILREIPGDRDAARRLLVDRTEAALRKGRLAGVDRAHLIFDTWPGAVRAGLRSRRGRVSWSYAQGSADEEILDYVRRHGRRRASGALVLVTDDRELGGRSRQLGARVVSVASFYGGGTPGPEADERRPPVGGPPFTAADFDLPAGEIDLDDPPRLD